MLRLGLITGFLIARLFHLVVPSSAAGNKISLPFKDQLKAALSVSLSDDGHRVAIGSSTHHVRVYEYISSHSTWAQLGADIATHEEDRDDVHSLTLSAGGNVMAIGTLRSVTIYEYSSSRKSWTQLHSVVLDDSSSDGKYPLSLSASGSLLAIGASSTNVSKVYKYNSGAWVQYSTGLQCGAGFFSSNSATVDACTPCPESTYSDRGSLACLPCQSA